VLAAAAVCDANTCVVCRRRLKLVVPVVLVAVRLVERSGNRAWAQRRRLQRRVAGLGRSGCSHRDSRWLVEFARVKVELAPLLCSRRRLTRTEAHEIRSARLRLAAQNVVLRNDAIVNRLGEKISEEKCSCQSVDVADHN
jgi:hypothetical protein